MVLQNPADEQDSITSSKTSSSIVLKPLINNKKLMTGPSKAENKLQHQLTSSSRMLKVPPKEADLEKLQQQQRQQKEVDKILKQKALDRVQRFEAQQKLLQKLKGTHSPSKINQSETIVPMDSNSPRFGVSAHGSLYQLKEPKLGLTNMLLHGTINNAKETKSTSSTDSARSRSTITMKGSPSRTQGVPSVVVSACTRVSLPKRPLEVKEPTSNRTKLYTSPSKGITNINKSSR